MMVFVWWSRFRCHRWTAALWVSFTTWRVGCWVWAWPTCNLVSIQFATRWCWCCCLIPIRATASWRRWLLSAEFSLIIIKLLLMLMRAFPRMLTLLWIKIFRRWLHCCCILLCLYNREKLLRWYEEYLMTKTMMICCRICIVNSLLQTSLSLLHALLLLMQGNCKTNKEAQSNTQFNRQPIDAYDHCGVLRSSS